MVEKKYYGGHNLTASQIKSTKEWFDSCYLLPDDKDKLILYIPMTIFGCMITCIGPIVSILLFSMWFIGARQRKIIEYRTNVLNWKKHSLNGLIEYLGKGGTL